MLILSCRCSPSLHTYVGHCGLMYSPSHLSGWVQQLFLVESRGNTVLFLCSSWLPCSRLDDSISSTTSLQLRFNCWPNTHFLLFGHDLYTASWVPLYITNKKHILYTSGQTSMAGISKRNLPRQLLVILVQKAEGETTAETFPDDMLFPRFCIYRE